ncbi:kinase-like domain-containing protein, partial [Favolaschia claudopus]
NIATEIEVMNRLRHPSVIEQIASIESFGEFCLVLEFMDGGELFFQVVRLGFFSEELCRHIMLQVAGGVMDLHDTLGIIHGDIKTENLLFRRIPYYDNCDDQSASYTRNPSEGLFLPGIGGGGVGIVKIADFGASCVLWHRKTTKFQGTDTYSAPEKLVGKFYGRAADMWALGCVLYIMLSGCQPFQGDDLASLEASIKRGCDLSSTWWDDITESAKDLVRYLLCKSETNRYTATQLLCHPWVLRARV